MGAIPGLPSRTVLAGLMDPEFAKARSVLNGDGNVALSPSSDGQLIEVGAALCCCPEPLMPEGGASDGSYRVEQPGCVGHRFKLELDWRWVASNEFKPCRLEWKERRSNVNPGDPDMRVTPGNKAPGETPWEDLPWGTYDELARGLLYGNHPTDELARNALRGPTLQPWYNSPMGGKYRAARDGTDAQAEERRDRVEAAKQKAQQDATGASSSVAIVDEPCLPFDPQRFPAKFQIEGHVILHAGCPASVCSLQKAEAHWAQLVSRDPVNGSVNSNYWAQWPEWRGSGGEDEWDVDGSGRVVPTADIRNPQAVSTGDLSARQYWARVMKARWGTK
jgi:hypothetical protein